MLTPHQQSVADKVLESLASTEPGKRYTLLSGLAGTGKTYTTNYIIGALGKYTSVAVTSTTHQACSVLNSEIEVEGIVVSTINSFLKMKPVYESAEFTLRTDDYWSIPIVDVLIIDEFSMLTNVVYETLEHYIGTCNPDLKVLLVGDATQLILEPDTINKLDLDDNTYFLEEPMRASKDSGIAEYGLAASAAIRANVAPPEINFDKVEDIVKYSDHSKFIEAWKESSSKLERDQMKVLCFTNAKVRSYNKHIKEDFYKQSEEYAPGNVIVIRNPVQLMKDGRKFSDRMLPNNSKILIDSVKELTIELEDGKTEKAYEVFPAGYMGASFRIPKSKASLDRYLQPLVDKKDWHRYYTVKDLFAFAHHAEAGTIHSAQGSSYDEIFIDASDIMTARSFRNRLAYVSITRAKSKVHIFLGETRNWDTFKK